MQLIVNGEIKQVAAPLSVAGLLTQLQVPSDRVAVELNSEIVQRDRWAATVLQDNDRIEIVHFVGGG